MTPAAFRRLGLTTSWLPALSCAITTGRRADELHSTIHSKELKMTALQGWIVIGLLVLIMLGIVGIGAEIEYLPYVWRTYSP
jgi:hypothetical protein